MPILLSGSYQLPRRSAYGTLSGEPRRKRLPAKKAIPPDEEAAELLRSMLIVQLKHLGVRNHKIRKIVGCGMSRVNAVLRSLPKEKKQAKK